MEWTPLINTDMFSGIYTDVVSCAGGILTIALTILGVGILYKVLTR